MAPARGTGRRAGRRPVPSVAEPGQGGGALRGPPSRLPTSGPTRAEPATAQPPAGRGAARGTVRRTRPPSPRARARPGAPAPPTVREVTGWLTRHPDRLTEDEHLGLKAILERCPELQAAADHVRAFGEMLTHLRGQELPAWIAAVRADADGLPGLGSFAAGLEHDLDAVTAGLTTRWNSGPVEGRVNHIKMVKRQMFGRAGLPLLRKRVLLTAARNDAACAVPSRK